MLEEPNSSRSVRDMLSLKLGGWLEAQATGRGVIVLGLIVFALLLAGLARFAIG